MSRRRLLISIATASTCILTISSCHPSGATIRVNGVLASVGDTFSFNKGDSVTITATATDWPDYCKTFTINSDINYNIAMEDELFGLINTSSSSAALMLRGVGTYDSGYLQGWQYSVDGGDTWVNATPDYNNDYVYFGSGSQDHVVPAYGKILIRQTSPKGTSHYVSGAGSHYLTFDSYIGSINWNVSGRLSTMTGTKTITSSAGDMGVGFAYLFSTSMGCGVSDASGLIIDVDIVQGDYPSFSYDNDYSCYHNMFYMSYLSRGPIIELDTLRPYMLKAFGAGCGEYIQDVTCYATDISATDCTAQWWTNLMAAQGNCFNLYVPQSMVSAWQAKGGWTNGYTNGYSCNTTNIIPLTHKVKIVGCNIPGATITINGVSKNVGDEVVLSWGATVAVEASYTGYSTFSKTFVLKNDTYFDINLIELPKWCDCYGVVVAPGPMYYNSTTNSYGVCSTWDQYCGYGQSSGYTLTANPQTYFSHLQVGNKFDSSGSQWATTVQSTAGSHNIDNGGSLVTDDLSIYNDWRLPTYNEAYVIIFGGIFDSQQNNLIQIRDGATVNNTSNVFSAYVEVSGQTIAYQNNGYVHGILIFPDNKTITGTNVLTNTSCYSSSSNPRWYYGNAGSSTVLTTAQLNAYIEQGCAFIPEGGYAYGDTSLTSWKNPSALTGSGFSNIMMPTTLFTTDDVGNQIWGGGMVTSNYGSGLNIESVINYSAPGTGSNYAACPCQVFLIRGSMDFSVLNYMVIINMMGTMYYVSSTGAGLDFSDLVNNPPTLYSSSVSDANKIPISSWSKPSSNVYRATLSNGHYYDITDNGGSYSVSYV